MDFKGRAKKWDSDSMIKRSEVVANKIKELVADRKECTVMEYGCATGLISFNLLDEFKQLTLMDSEEEMIEVIKEKIIEYKTDKVIPIKVDLQKENYSRQKFDVIYTSMTLHHILEIEQIIKKFHNMLNENGILCIIDLDKEDGTFHINEKDFNGHNGFEHIQIENAFKNAGFLKIKSETFYNSEKTYQDKIIPYSMFYTIGQK